MEVTSEIIKDLSERFGNAFYLLDSEQFEKNYDALSAAFRAVYPHFNIAYSYKTNYTPKLCRIVNSKGGYAEVVSDMELEIALRVGVSPERIIWNGPIKNAKRAEWLLLAGGCVNIDSLCELEMIKNIALAHSESVLSLGIRCNYDVCDGVVSRFGIDVESDDFIRVLEFFKATENVRLVGLHSHFAKRSIKYWPAKAEGMLGVIDLVREKLGYIPQRIDLGGGIYGNMAESLKKQFSDPIPSYAEYASAAAPGLAKRFPDADVELIIEPGSALAGDCMRFVGRVESIKNIRGKHFATILGSQKNISMSGVNPPIRIIACGESGEEYTDLDIVGYTCIESDVMYKNYSGPLAVGDYIEFSNCGSYSLVMKPPFILPNFPVLDICSGEAEVIKRAEIFDDLFHTFLF